MYKTSREETPFDPTIPEKPGWEGMFVHWLATRDAGGTETTVFNVTELPPNRAHELHKHDTAEEFFYVVEGAGLHLTDGEPTIAVTVMGGVSHYSDAGYDIHPVQPDVIPNTN